MGQNINYLFMFTGIIVGISRNPTTLMNCLKTCDQKLYDMDPHGYEIR